MPDFKPGNLPDYTGLVPGGSSATGFHPPTDPLANNPFMTVIYTALVESLRLA